MRLKDSFNILLLGVLEMLKKTGKQSSYKDSNSLAVDSVLMNGNKNL